MRTKTRMIRIEEQLYTRLAAEAGSMSLTRFVNDLLDEALATRKNVELDKRAAEWAEAERELYGSGVPDNTPTPENLEQPKAAEQQQPAEQPGLPCCNQSSPCRHWRWDAQLAVWQNILTGEVREAQ